MIDAIYFRTKLADQIKRMGLTPTVKLHLTDGTSLTLFSTEAVEEGYVLVQAYPDGANAKLRQDAQSSSLENGPRFTVPYECIARVELTLDSQRDRGLGFHLDPAFRG